MHVKVALGIRMTGWMECRLSVCATVTQRFAATNVAQISIAEVQQHPTDKKGHMQLQTGS